MKNISRKRGGFTLIEIIITLCIIGILSISIHAMYLSMITTTKHGEIRQKSAINAKEISESIKSLKNDNFEKVSDNEIKIKKFSVFKDKSISTLNLTKEGSEEEYKGTIYFDEKFNVSKASARYKCHIDMSKVKAVYDRDRDYYQYVSLKRDGVEIDNNDMENHDINISVEKNEDDDKANINGKSFSNKLKAEIDKDDDNTVHMYIKDEENTVLYEESVSLNRSKTSCINLNFNFDNFKEEEKDDNTEISINVYNRLSQNQNAVVHVYVEKADNAKVTVSPKNGEIYIGNRYENDNVSNVGDLYSITVNVVDTSDNNNLFSSEILKNIEIS